MHWGLRKHNWSCDRATAAAVGCRVALKTQLLRHRCRSCASPVLASPVDGQGQVRERGLPQRARAQGMGDSERRAVDEVSRNLIWREHLRKEARLAFQPATFKVNPRTSTGVRSRARGDMRGTHARGTRSASVPTEAHRGDPCALCDGRERGGEGCAGLAAARGVSGASRERVCGQSLQRRRRSTRRLGTASSPGRRPAPTSGEPWRGCPSLAPRADHGPCACGRDGWKVGLEERRRGARWLKPLKSCVETKYSSEYMANFGVSPYASAASDAVKPRGGK